MISIIVPVYCVEKFLRQCLNSILNQTYTDIEIILIDDGSPDSSGNICDEYALKDSRVKVFHTENRGVAEARNYGIKKAKGEYIGLVDSDDWIEPEMYATMLQAIEDNNADMSICGYVIESEASQKEDIPEPGVYTKSEVLERLLAEKINKMIWNKLYKKEIFNKVSFPSGKNYEDILTSFRITEETSRVAVVPYVGYHYRMWQESITKTYTAKNLIDYAEAHMSIYLYFEKNEQELFVKKQEIILFYAAKGISRVWRWWHATSKEERRERKEKTKIFKDFTKKNIPFFGFKTWPFFMRISSIFMRSNSALSFAIMYRMNRIFRTVKPDRANTL